jgi:hypothetical protein
MCVIFIKCRFFDLEIGLPDARKRNPVIIALVKVLEVDVVGVGIFIFWFGGIIIYNKIKIGRNKKLADKFP